MKLIRIFSLIALIILPIAVLSQFKGDAVLGYFITSIEEESSEFSQIEMYRNKNGKYYGKVVWMSNPKNIDNSPVLDIHNPDPLKRKNKLIGTNILSEFTYNHDKNTWDNGFIYNPLNGKSYKATMSLENNDKLLSIRGYIGKSWMMLGRTVKWKREYSLKQN